MKHLKKIAALLLAAVLVLAMAGCNSDPAVDPATAEEVWAAKLGEEELPGGLYNMYLMAGYMEADATIGQSDNLLKEKIDGVSAEEYIKNYADEAVRGILSVRAKFNELNLELTENEKIFAEYYAQYYYNYNNDYYVANGVKLENLVYMLESEYMIEAVFNAIYGEGGEREYPVEELRNKFENDYTRSLYIMFEKFDDEGNTLDEAGVAELRKSAEGYLARAEAGEDMIDLDIEYYNASLAEGEEPYVRSEADGEQAEQYVVKENSGYPDIYVETVFAMADNEIRMCEDDNYIFIIKRLPITETPENTRTSYLEAVLSGEKSEEFSALLEEWAAQAEPEYNEEALKIYRPEMIRATSEKIAAQLINMGLYNTSSSSSSSESEGTQSSGESSQAAS